MLKIGKVKFMLGRLEKNCHIYHPDRPDGQRFEMKRGPAFKYCRLEVHKPSTGHRLWFYFPSGACWNVDMYIDRRNLKQTA